MSVSSSTVKSVSRKIFKENFINAVVATTILVMTWLVCYYLFAVVYTVTEMAFSSAIYYFSLVFILFPLLLGLIRYYWRMSSGVADNPAAVFYYFSSGHLYLKAFKLIFMVLLRTLCCYAVMYLPVLVLNLITGSWLYKTLNLSMPIWAVNFSNVIYILHFLSLVGTLLFMLKYYMAPMLFVADENMEPAEAMHLSVVVSKRSSLDFVFLCFGFLVCILLSFLMLPLIFTLPYMLISYLLHCSYAVADFNEEISNISLDEIPTFIAGG